MKNKNLVLFLIIFLFVQSAGSLCPAGTSIAGDVEEAKNILPDIQPKKFKDPATGMEFMPIKGGCFEMGDTFGDGMDREKPVHQVCVENFYIGRHEVTQGQWKQIMGNNPSYFKNCGDNCPVENIRWNDVQEFIKRLNEKTHPTIPLNKDDNPLLFPLNKGGKRGLYRLLTEAEWEYAARSGGRKEKWAGTNIESELGDYAWYEENSGSKTHAVGQKKPNGLGIYDMGGNVWELVQDVYSADAYKQGSGNNLLKSNMYHVKRGGGWNCEPVELRTSLRNYEPEIYKSPFLGFRLATDK